jgi:hypothetical protein
LLGRNPELHWRALIGCKPALPWDVWDWPAQVHLALFVHRVEGLVPGIYAFLRDDVTAGEWQQAMRPQFLWEPVGDEASLGNGALFLLLPFDMVWPATRVSCDQDIAGAGFFSLGMLAPVGRAVAQHGGAIYRRLFWEAGLIGQVLYLDAEAAGARSTGIGCFYDDAVHELLGLPPGSTVTDGQASGAGWQSLYHFSMGMPVEDTRYRSLDLAGSRHIQADRLAGSPGGGDRLGHGCRVLFARRGHHMRPLRRQPLGDRAADPP